MKRLAVSTIDEANEQNKYGLRKLLVGRGEVADLEMDRQDQCLFEGISI
jgi:hypothetical protein